MSTLYELGAGGVVLGSPGEVLLVRYADGGWTFPKGHIDAGETKEETAVREVWEETGVHATILFPLSETRYTNARGVARQISWFLMQAKATQTHLEPLFNEGGFYPIDQALSLLSYPQDQQLLREAIQLSLVRKAEYR